MGFVLIQCPSRMLSDSAVSAAASSGTHMEEKGQGGLRTLCLMIIQLDPSPFHFPDPTHHLYNLLLLRSEEPEIFPSISMAFLP